MSDWAGLLLFFIGALLASGGLTAVNLAMSRRLNWRAPVRDDAPSRHQCKQGTPSAGGLAVIAVVLAAGAVVARSTGSAQGQVVAIVWLAAVFAALGFVDDYLKSRHGSTLGVRARYRLPAEAIVALGFVWLAAGYMSASQSSVLGFAGLPMAVRIILGVLVVVGSANAVNLTDGLDGLAGGLTAICAGGLAVVCLIIGANQLAALTAVTAGAAAGFLWLNRHPAQIFMGDVGSLGLGALLGGIAVAGGIELIFALIAVVFVGEALSVIIQVIWFRWTGRRVFAMTPIHHAFELRGWAEPQIVVRFWMVGLVAAIVGVVVAMNIA